MGLIKAAVSAVGSTFHDQWKDVIRCEDMDNNTLMVRKTSDSGVLNKKSAIIVAPSQLAIIYDNGKIVDATAEEGVYTFDESTSPSFFAGQFGAVFKEMWERFTFGGGTSKQQAVFFINLKEIVDNKFGTPAPIPYGDWGHPNMNARTGVYIPLSVEIKCFGKYTFKIVDPAVFMKELAGIADVYTKEMVEDVIRTEVISVFQNLLSSLGNDEEGCRVPALQLPNKTDEIRKMMDEVMFDEQIRRRGLSIVSFAVESVTFTDESKKKIDEYELGGDVYNQKAKLVGSYGDALKAAASNEAGAVNGFMGMGFLNMNTGNMAAGAVNGAMNQEMPKGPDMQEYNKKTTKKCPKCGADVTGKFCSECGTEIVEKKCPKCGAIVTGKFCSECGTNTEE